MSKILVGIIAVFILIGGFASGIISGVHTWRTDDTTEAFSVVTAAGVTSANVTLTGDLFNASTSEVITISSNATESPAATSYTEATNVLLVSSLNAATTRTLTVNYYAETEDTALRAIGPFLNFLIIGGCLALIFVGMFQFGSRRRR